MLVAEDNEVNQIVVTTMLEQRGFAVDLARNGLEAVAMSAARDYAAIFMDCQMPELDGYEATARIRASGSGARTPIIAMTAHAAAGDREKCLAAGMSDYLSIYLAKPLRGDDLDEALARWVPSRPNGASRSGNHDPRRPLGGRLDAELVAMIRADFQPSDRARLLEIFEESLDGSLEAMERAAAHDELEELRRRAHQLKGSAATLGARALSDACHALEQRAASCDGDPPAVDMRALVEVARGSRAELRAALLDR